MTLEPQGPTIFDDPRPDILSPQIETIPQLEPDVGSEIPPFPSSTEEDDSNITSIPLPEEEGVQIITSDGSGTESASYEPPEGGGGITDTVKIGDRTVTFGHGGRHLEGTGLDMNRVNNALAEEAAGLELQEGQYYSGQISIDGVTIKYSAYGVSDTITNIGTYYPID